MLVDDHKMASEKEAGGIAAHALPRDSPRSSSGDADHVAEIDPVAERRLVRKLDLIIFPTFFVIYMMSFLDRINISNAKIQGLIEDLDLYGNRFNVALLVYFISYILMEVPSNMIIKKVRPSLYISALMFIWGIVNLCMGFAQNYATLVALRFLLGMFEAGVLPGIIFVTSSYYKRHEYQKRMSFFFTSTVVAGAFGGLIAYAIARLARIHHFSAWRWIFIIEGAITSAIAVIAAFIIIDWPENTKWLNAKEKEILRLRLIQDVGDSCHMDTLDRKAFRRIMRDPKIWLGAMMYLGVGVAGYAGAFFLPTILVEFNWKPEEAQVHTIPVYVFTAGVMLLGAWASDRLKHRFGFMLGGACMCTIGLSMLLAQEGKSRDFKFGAVFLVFGGAYTVTPMALGWLQNNLCGRWKRAFGAALQVMLGNFSGIVGSNIFLMSEKPRYVTGYSMAMAMMWFGTLAAFGLFLVMWRENKKRDAGERDYRLELPEDERNNLGDDHPSFRFTL